MKYEGAVAAREFGVLFLLWVRFFCLFFYNNYFFEEAAKQKLCGFDAVGRFRRRKCKQPHLNRIIYPLVSALQYSFLIEFCFVLKLLKGGFVHMWPLPRVALPAAQAGARRAAAAAVLFGASF